MRMCSSSSSWASVGYVVLARVVGGDDGDMQLIIIIIADFMKIRIIII